MALRALETRHASGRKPVPFHRVHVKTILLQPSRSTIDITLA
jgi:hypothetical protein